MRSYRFKSTSQHTKGEAVDFEIAGVSNLQVALWINNNCDFDQLFLEYWKEEDNDPNSGWVHCSFAEKSNRKQVLTFNGKKYINDYLTQNGQMVNYKTKRSKLCLITTDTEKIKKKKK